MVSSVRGGQYHRRTPRSRVGQYWYLPESVPCPHLVQVPENLYLTRRVQTGVPPSRSCARCLWSFSSGSADACQHRRHNIRSSTTEVTNVSIIPVNGSILRHKHKHRPQKWSPQRFQYRHHQWH
eukprot:3159995-Rhodomonas_salina.7